MRWHPGGKVAVTQVGTLHCLYLTRCILATNSFISLAEMEALRSMLFMTQVHKRNLPTFTLLI
jgi:hypothetical protein